MTAAHLHSTRFRIALSKSLGRKPLMVAGAALFGRAPVIAPIIDGEFCRR